MTKPLETPEEEEFVSIDPPLELDPAKAGITIPPGSTVYVMNSRTDPPWTTHSDFIMRKEGGKFIFDGKVPVGKMEFKFYIVPPGGEPFWFPAGENLMREIERPPREEETEVPSSTSDISVLREYLGAQMASILDLSRGEEAAGENLYRRLTQFRNYTAELAETGDESVRTLVTSDLEDELNQRHNAWITGRKDLPTETRKALNTPQKRLEFRLKVFNVLCQTEQLGLSPKDKPTGKMNESTFLEHAKKRLGRNWGVYDRICSEYDGGSARRALDSIVDEAIKALPSDTLERAKERARERANLAAEVEKRIRTEVGDTYTVDMERRKMAGFLEAGGDLALKYAVIAGITSSPLLGLALWGARGISEGFGYDFGSVLEQFAKAPFQLVAWGGKGALNRLPDAWKAKMPKGVQEWLSKPNPPTFERLRRVSLSWGDRWRLFIRGFIPIPAVAEKIPYVGAIVPERRLEVGKLASKEREKAEAAVREACHRALSPGKGKKTEAREPSLPIEKSVSPAT